MKSDAEHDGDVLGLVLVHVRHHLLALRVRSPVNLAKRLPGRANRLKVLRVVLPQVRERAAFVSTSSAGSCRPYIRATTAAKRRCSRFNCLFPALQPADPGRPRCIGNGMTAPARLPRPQFSTHLLGQAMAEREELKSNALRFQQSPRCCLIPLLRAGRFLAKI
jgi:hypothetical protein